MRTTFKFLMLTSFVLILLVGISVVSATCNSDPCAPFAEGYVKCVGTTKWQCGGDGSWRAVGTCPTCPSNFPKYCQEIGLCFADWVDCRTPIYCKDNYYGCGCGFKLCCKENSPVCVKKEINCAAVRRCDGSWGYCENPNQCVECANGVGYCVNNRITCTDVGKICNSPDCYCTSITCTDWCGHNTKNVWYDANCHPPVQRPIIDVILDAIFNMLGG